MLSKGDVLKLDYVSSGLPFLKWIGADIDTGTLDYEVGGLPYNTFLEEDTILLELAGSIDAVSSLSGTLFQNEFAELAGVIAAESIVGKKIAGTDYTSNLSLYISLAGSMSAVSGITETAFLGLDVYRDEHFYIGDFYGYTTQWEIKDIPIEPKPNFWEDISNPGGPNWVEGDTVESFWRQIAPVYNMGWTPKEKGSQFWRPILPTKRRIWERGQDAKQISDH